VPVTLVTSGGRSNPLAFVYGSSHPRSHARKR
jgi:hypothetical protein